MYLFSKHLLQKKLGIETVQFYSIWDDISSYNERWYISNDLQQWLDIYHPEYLVSQTVPLIVQLVAPYFT